MAIKTKQELRDYWNANISANDANAITGSKHNVGGIDIIDSMAMGTDVSSAPTTHLGFGTIATGGGWITPSALHTWAALIFPPNTHHGPFKNFINDHDKLKINFPVPHDTPIYVNISVTLSIRISANQPNIVLIAHGLNGAVPTEVESLASVLKRSDSGHTDATTMMTYNWNGVIPNGSYVEAYIMTPEDSTESGEGLSITASGIVVV